MKLCWKTMLLTAGMSITLPLCAFAQDAEAPEAYDAAADQEALVEHDEGLKATLDENDIAYRMLKNGDFVLPFKVSDENQRIVAVVVTSKTTQFGERKLRSIFATLKRVDGPIEEDLARQLLTQNTVLPIGCWAIQTTPTGRTLVLFKVQIDVDASGKELQDLAKYVAAITWRTFQGLDEQGLPEDAEALPDSE